MALMLGYGVQLNIEGDGISTDIAIDLRQLSFAFNPNANFGFVEGVLPDSLISVSIADSSFSVSGTLSGHTLTLTFSPALTDGEGFNVSVDFGFDGH